MKRVHYDLHVHSCLSPCADDDMTPHSIAGMAVLGGLDVIALTDHNTCLNCPALMEACREYGIVPVPGMELTTAEDIHLVCLFPALEDALAFSEEVRAHRLLVQNRKNVFGNQFIVDGQDEIVGEEAYLLINATDLSLDGAAALVSAFGGACFPAHIDRESNGMLAILGAFPDSPDFKCVELNDRASRERIERDYQMGNRRVLVSSDAHQLGNINERGNTVLLDIPEDAGEAETRAALIRWVQNGGTA